VILFFVLSGFVLTLVLESSKLPEGPTAQRFFISRIFRIYPAVITTLAIIAALYSVTGYTLISPNGNTAFNYLLNASLIQPAILGVTWSLQLELIAAPLLFGVWWWRRREGLRALLVPYFILLGLSFTSIWNYLIGQPFSLGQLYAFLAGMAAFLYGKQFVKGMRYPGLWLMLAIAAFAATRPLVGWSSYWTILLESLFGSAIVALLAFSGFRFARGLFGRTVEFYGRTSFSFYLLHPLTLIPLANTSALTTLLQSGVHPLILAALIFVISTIATTPFAWAQWYFVEQTGIWLGRRLPIARPASIQTA
jgi:peptidoglycan/LPS O-acetylase OafA/YrhL